VYASKFFLNLSIYYDEDRPEYSVSFLTLACMFVLHVAYVFDYHHIVSYLL